MSANLKNYTSGVPVERSIMLIERALVRAGALHISKTYDESKEINGMMFQIVSGQIPLIFKLPVKWREAQKCMEKQVRRPHRGTMDKIKEQAKRTAWKILFEWVTIQISLIELEQAELAEVFLPYVYDQTKDETLFEKLKGTNFRMITQKAGGEK